MRDFYHVGRDATLLAVVNARDARRGALKVATRGFDDAYIVDPALGKVHHYALSRRPLTESERTHFSEAHNITSKPTAVKLDYHRLPGAAPPSNEWPGSDAQQRVRRALNQE